MGKSAKCKIDTTTPHSSITLSWEPLKYQQSAEKSHRYSMGTRKKTPIVYTLNASFYWLCSHNHFSLNGLAINQQIDRYSGTQKQTRAEHVSGFREDRNSSEPRDYLIRADIVNVLITQAVAPPWSSSSVQQTNKKKIKNPSVSANGRYSFGQSSPAPLWPRSSAHEDGISWTCGAAACVLHMSPNKCKRPLPMWHHVVSLRNRPLPET